MLSLLSRQLLRHGVVSSSTTTSVNRVLLSSTLPSRCLSTSVVESKSPEQLMEQFDDMEIRTELSKLRDAEADLMSQLKVADVNIDWAYWKKTIKYPGLVDAMQKEYENAEVPNIEEETNGMMKHMDNMFDPIINQYDQMAKDAQEDTERIEKQLEEIHFLRDNIKDLTLEEFFEKYPAIKKSIEQDITNSKWFIE